MFQTLRASKTQADAAVIEPVVEGGVPVDNEQPGPSNVIPVSHMLSVLPASGSNTPTHILCRIFQPDYVQERERERERKR